MLSEKQKLKKQIVNCLAFCKKYISFLLLFILLFFSLGFYLYSLQLNPNPVLVSTKTTLVSSNNPSVTVAHFKNPRLPLQQPVKVPILTYHYVEVNRDKNDTLRTSMAVTPYFFEKQLQTFLQHGYKVISFRDLTKALEGEEALPPKPVILTFDDGYRDFYTDAYPLLKKYQIKATNFVIYNHLGRSGNLTKEQVKEMLASGLVTIGSHTLNHANLVTLKPERARAEILESKKKLEEEFGIKVLDFAYPYGFYNHQVEELVKEAGYETASSLVVGVQQSSQNVFHLSRIKVGNYADNFLLSRLEKFK